MGDHDGEMEEHDGGKCNLTERLLDSVREELRNTDYSFDMPDVSDMSTMQDLRKAMRAMNRRMEDVFGKSWLLPTPAELEMDPAVFACCGMGSQEGYEGEGASRMFVVECAVPGANPENLHVTLNGNTLTIDVRADVRTQSSAEKSQGARLMQGFAAESFRQVIELPQEVDTSGEIIPTYENGVLIVRIPCPERNSRVLPVRVSSNDEQHES